MNDSIILCVVVTRLASFDSAWHRTLRILDLAMIKAQGIGNVCCSALFVRAYGAFPVTLHVNDLKRIVSKLFSIALELCAAYSTSPSSCKL